MASVILPLPTEGSPLLQAVNSVGPDSLTRSSNEETYATWVSKTWLGWNRGVRGLVLILGASLIIAAIILVASVTSSSTSSLEGESDNNNLRASPTEEGYGLALEIPQGKLKWSNLQSREGRKYYAFYKVPYAQPPLEDLRFESPQPPEEWEGIREEKEVAPQCLQKSKYSPINEAVGEEDCLYANIYTPKLPGIDLTEKDSLMPVLFYVHGGGFSDGNGSRYGGKYFMDEDVILVTFQYRLGIFGFLSSEDGTIKGNMAMKDQVQALKWVNENIKYFGGDQDRIMIFGNSAGAVSVNQLVVSPMSAGLYSRAITQSGVTFTISAATKQQQLKSYENLATEIGCWSRIGNERLRNRRVLRCLRKQNASEIAVIRGEGIMFASTIETYESEDETDKFLPAPIYQLYKEGRVNKHPWIIGVNSAEWIGNAIGILKDPELVDNLNSNWTSYALSLFDTPIPNISETTNVLLEKVKDFYFGEKLVGNETLVNLTNLLSDVDIVYPSKTEGMLMAGFWVDVFLYYMSKRPPKSYSDKVLEGYPPEVKEILGASHADELQYLFNYYGYPEYLVGSEYFSFSRELVRIWANFAATGKAGWDPIKQGQKPISWYELNDNMGPTTVLQERMEFWDQFTHEQLGYAATNATSAT